MDKQTHTKFNLNNFLMAFSNGLDNTIPNNENGVKHSSKAVAYIALRLANQLNIGDDIKSDIFSYCIVMKNNTFLQNIHNIPFNNQKSLNSDEVTLIINIASFVIEYIKVQDNTIINEKDIKNILNDNNTIPTYIIDAFNTITKQESFWYNLMNPQIVFEIFDQLKDFTQEILFDDLIKFTAIVHDCVYNYTKRDYENSCIDFKAYEMCQYFEFENKDKARFIIASHLHNIGLLFISQDILQKPNRLHHSEFQIIKQAPYFTTSILKQIVGFDDIAKLCSNYMEKIDSSGYPNKKGGESLSLKDRLLSVLSAYQALSENRIYRKSFNHNERIEILHKEKFDAELIKILSNFKQ
jgi:HD-GYP domain-containing protein (c-di-GMP phosphodiesterase class II)